ncbi:MAG: DUF3047 domain-containing protein [Usitatibacteraceae bacterium]
MPCSSSSCPSKRTLPDGTSRNGRWLVYERNIAQDFERAFGEKPGRILSLGIMTDTDNTGEATVAYYGDIHFSPKPLTKKEAQ